MKILKLLMAIILLSSCMRKNPELNIIPKPQEINFKSDKPFKLGDELTIIYSADSCSSLAKLLSQYLSEYNQKSTIGGLKNDVENNFIKFEIKKIDNLNSEGYLLRINEKGVTIASSTLRGLFNGVQTLRQMLYQISSTKKELPCVEIKDQPRFAWRGMHLDVSRHFMPKEYIKKYIDYIAFFKMNVFHWHLVDDQGWRIEIKKYPKLTEVGAWRKQSRVGHEEESPVKYDGVKHGGFYTQEDIKEIVQYAKERYITILPEIEMPGHSQAAIAAYPYLGCTNDSIEVWTNWGVSPNIYNLQDSTFKFLQDVLDEVMVLFPGKYIHIGGDEADKINWESSKKIQRQMQNLGLKNVQELQSYFINRIEKYLNSKGRIMIGWDEILEGGVAPNAVVMSWRGEAGGIAAIKLGHPVIMTPEMPCYFDHSQSTDTTEPLSFGGYTPLDSVYFYDPIPKEIPASKAYLVLGSQGNVWTEYLPTPSNVDYMVFPRMLALSEVLWTQKNLKNYPDFKKRLLTFENYFKSQKINYAKHVFKE